MLATDDYPTRTIVHPPRLRGGLGRGLLNVLVAANWYKVGDRTIQ
ncbi:hypothetical protein B6N60_00975 [Richelia sinica FACHB-800]|uniref:Uncharacterized protein n=1 Tax=Richelia sinica FACHB-800 TaxID=1357546 RepID=A0A975T509_9NOST|nr:hypothetical protein [Richelia sinica]QXE22293.1 hypothetical protein B6N60_00975 [Richelia sinica FACHB-800]